MSMNLTCASDAYKFDLEANVVDRGRRDFGHLERDQPQCQRRPCRAAAAAATSRSSPCTAGFNANITLRTAGNKQIRQHQSRQHVPRRQYLAVEITAYRCRSNISSHAELALARALAGFRVSRVSPRFP